MIDIICEYFYKLFHPNVYWDQYGIYDLESGLMIDYFVPAQDEVIYNKVEQPEIWKSKREDPSLFQTNIIGQEQDYLGPDYILRKIESERKNAEFREACIIGNKEKAQINSSQIVNTLNAPKEIRVRYILMTHIVDELTYKIGSNRPFFIMHLLDGLHYFSSDIYTFKENKNIEFKVEEYLGKDGMSYKYEFHLYNCHFFDISLIKPGYRIFKKNNFS